MLSLSLCDVGVVAGVAVGGVADVAVAVMLSWLADGACVVDGVSVGAGRAGGVCISLVHGVRGAVVGVGGAVVGIVHAVGGGVGVSVGAVVAVVGVGIVCGGVAGVGCCCGW